MAERETAAKWFHQEKSVALLPMEQQQQIHYTGIHRQPPLIAVLPPTISSNLLHKMNRDDMTQHFLTFTAAICGLAILTGILLICVSKCCNHRRIRRRPKKPPAESTSKSPLIYCSNLAIAIDCPEMDYIDSRNSELISSTVQISSLHNSPISTPVFQQKK
uniref:Uncharacterized protein n=1 Tax=Ditylenchus dipsaci TaxID=166011 RepID=A0A915ECL1_9BILA